jgi:hypothetical protein
LFLYPKTVFFYAKIEKMYDVMSGQRVTSYIQNQLIISVMFVRRTVHQPKLPVLLTSKYLSIPDVGHVLGDSVKVRELFIDFQKHLFERYFFI